MDTLLAAMSARCEHHAFQMRRITSDDADGIHHAMSDWEVAQWLSSPPWPYNRDEALSFAKKAAASIAAPLPIHCAIACKSTDDLMGMVGVVRRDGDVSVGYWLGRAHWGLGIMTAALSITCAAVFKTLSDERIVSYVFEGNGASLRVQEKLGFEVTGHGTDFCRPRNMNMKTTITELQKGRFAEAMT